MGLTSCVVAIQCFAKGDLYPQLLEVYPPKDFSYHLLTKYHDHQYLKERVFKNLAVKLRKS